MDFLSMRNNVWIKRPEWLPTLVPNWSLRSPNSGNSNWKTPPMPYSEVGDVGRKLSIRSAVTVSHVWFVNWKSSMNPPGGARRALLTMC